MSDDGKNESDAPMVWLDGLDMHLVNLLDASFRENYPGQAQPVTRPEGSSYAEAGRNLLPVDFRAAGAASPIFNYPYRATREALEKLRRFRDPDPSHGLKMRYVSWHPLQMEASTDAVLFSFSDQIVQEKLGLFREQCGEG